MRKLLALLLTFFCILPSIAWASRTCQFTQGPRAGTSFYFPPNVPIIEAPIGAPCTDGMGSYGYAVQDQNTTTRGGRVPDTNSTSVRGAPTPTAPPHGGYPNDYKLNHETQVGLACVSQFGVSKAAAGCIVSTLTATEIEKCINKGVGGDGCFGTNNTLVNMVSENYEAAKREGGVIGGVIRAGTGVSVKDIQQHGILGGCNSDARKVLGMGC